MTGPISAYIAAAVVFLALDAAWLRLVAQPMFERNLGAFLLESPRLGVAAGFYALYVGGIVYFAVWPALAEGSARQAVVNGAILGFIAYGTYEATNLATLKGWTWGMLAMDLSWGVALTAAAAGAGHLAGRWIGG